MNKLDQFMESPWFMRVVALLLAILLYTSVSFEEVDLKKKETNTGKGTVETIGNVPVHVIYDSKNLVVSGVPQTVSVTIEGPRNIVQSTKNLQNFKVFVDLSDIGIGEHEVPIKYDNISDKLKVKLEPAFANVSVQEKVTKEFKVEAEFNNSILADGFQVESLSVQPKRVRITGAKDVIDQISYVKATLDVDRPVDKETTGEARVRVLDRELNKLDVAVEPETVRVTMNVKNPSKKVEVKVKEMGSPPSGVKITEVVPEPKDITIYGKESVLEKVESVEVKVDLSKIKESKIVEVPVELQEGLTYSSPKSIKVRVNVEGSEVAKEEVEKVEETKPLDGNMVKNFSNVPIQTRGLNNAFLLAFLPADSGNVNMTVTGIKSVMENVSEKDLSAYIDVTGLTVGEHQVPIKATSPKSTEFTLSKDQVTVEISDNSNRHDT
ncbi:YbbR domain-containing protein [Oikeobacillus pervagus]|uniref:YbbR domain-containing protein n=1 Tax=Oikeobacillus pervagus TaxID=1325931 RepID=A0AAJ1WKK0_9BACI|nr:CdaR family protein [Oikeobacillus pervagus]MDQ0216688.1 YbbR domain-containing protein [Oikeobacillus pervagus]